MRNFKMFKVVFIVVTVLALLLIFVISKKGETETKELLDYFDGLYQREPADSPARYALNEIAHRTSWRAINILRENWPASDDEREKAFEKMKKLRERINLGLKWPRKTPPAFEIPRAEAVPVIDGNISEPSWNSALTFNGSYPLDSLKKEDDGSIWKIMRDNEYIYVCAYFPDAELFATDRPGHPYRADSLEVFIMPSKRMKKYWEVVVGCDGDLFDGLHCNNRYGRWVSGPEAVMKGLKFKVLKQKAGYSVEIAIPFAELPNYMLGNKPRAGEVIYFALVKTDKDTENGKTKFYSAFPLLYGGHNIFGHAKGTLKK